MVGISAVAAIGWSEVVHRSRSESSFSFEFERNYSGGKTLVCDAVMVVGGDADSIVAVGKVEVQVLIWMVGLRVRVRAVHLPPKTCAVYLSFLILIIYMLKHFVLL
jgi:hypothetical protein